MQVRSEEVRNNKDDYKVAKKKTKKVTRYYQESRWDIWEKAVSNLINIKECYTSYIKRMTGDFLEEKEMTDIDNRLLSKIKDVKDMEGIFWRAVECLQFQISNIHIMFNKRSLKDQGKCFKLTGHKF